MEYLLPQLFVERLTLKKIAPMAFAILFVLTFLSMFISEKMDERKAVQLDKKIEKSQKEILNLTEKYSFVSSLKYKAPSMFENINVNNHLDVLKFDISLNEKIKNIDIGQKQTCLISSHESGFNNPSKEALIKSLEGCLNELKTSLNAELSSLKIYEIQRAAIKVTESENRRFIEDNNKINAMDLNYEEDPASKF